MVQEIDCMKLDMRTYSYIISYVRIHTVTPIEDFASKVDTVKVVCLCPQNTCMVVQLRTMIVTGIGPHWVWHEIHGKICRNLVWRERGGGLRLR